MNRHMPVERKHAGGNVEWLPSAMLSFECCNRLCRLPEQELSALPMLNCSMLNVD